MKLYEQQGTIYNYPDKPIVRNIYISDNQKLYAKVNGEYVELVETEYKKYKYV